MAYQTYSHVLDLSVAENLYLAAPRSQQPSYGRMEEWASAKLAEFGLEVPVGAPTRRLSLANRQFLEVIKALLARPKVLLLDEPTTAFGPEDVERLHEIVLEQSRAGVGIAYVSHRLPEVLGIADRVTVLRDGVGQGTFEAASMSEESLVALMIGRPLQLAFPERHDAAAEREVLLAVSGLQGDRFGPIDLEVAKGEIVGIAGAEGNGQVPFLRALAGAEHSTGSATCNGRELDTRSPLGPLRAGVVLLSGDRTGEALFPVLSVRANSTIQVLRRLGRFGFLNRRREQRTVDDIAKRLSIRMASIEQPVQSLSGGNQQKVSLTRPFLRGGVSVILAEEPTQGVDVGARFDIYDALREKAQRRRRDRRQVERPARARGALRPGGRDLPREDRRRDPRRGPRRAPDRRGDRRRARSRRGEAGHEFGARVAAAIAGIRFRGVVPLALMTTLILAVGAYTAVRQDAFLTSYNLRNLLLATMPLALVAMGQTCALLVGGFDVSVGALLTLCVVVASYTMTPTTSTWGLIPGALALVGVGFARRRLQRAARPGLPPALDHRHARHAQHPPGDLALAARPSLGIDLEQRHRRVDDELELRAARVHRGHRARAGRRLLALPHPLRAWRCGRSASTRRPRAGSGSGPTGS